MLARQKKEEIDTELLDLCEQVYEATRWGDEAIYPLWVRHHNQPVPVYNSDYVMAKIGGGVRCGIGLFAWATYKKRSAYADTPLKALLKLVLLLIIEEGFMEDEEANQ